MILGVLGGSGLYDIDGLADARSAEVSTPFGAPSGPLLGGRVGDARVLFLPRHGAGHRFSPVGDQLPRQRLRAQGGGGDAGAVGLGGRLAARGDAAGRSRSSPTSSSTRPTGGRPPSSATGWSGTSASPSRPARRSARRSRPRRRRPASWRHRRRRASPSSRAGAASDFTGGAPTSAWRVRSSRRAPSRSCTGAGARISSA